MQSPQLNRAAAAPTTISSMHIHVAFTTVDAMTTGSPVRQLQCARHSSLLPALAGCISSSTVDCDKSLRPRACQALLKIPYNNPTAAGAIFEAGALPGLLRLLTSPTCASDRQCGVYAGAAVSQLVSMHPASRSTILSSQPYMAYFISRLARSESIDARQSAAHTVAMLVGGSMTLSGDELPSIEIEPHGPCSNQLSFWKEAAAAASPGLPEGLGQLVADAHLLLPNDDSCSSAVMGALNAMYVGGPAVAAREVAQRGFMEGLEKILRHPFDFVGGQTQGMATFGNICSIIGLLMTQGQLQQVAPYRSAYLDAIRHAQRHVERQVAAARRQGQLQISSMIELVLLGQLQQIAGMLEVLPEVIGGGSRGRCGSSGSSGDGINSSSDSMADTQQQQQSQQQRASASVSGTCAPSSDGQQPDSTPQRE